SPNPGPGREWATPAAQQARLAPPKPGRIGSADGKRRDVAKRDLDRLKRGKECLAIRGEPLKHGKRNGSFFAKGTDTGAAQGGHMAKGAERPAEVPGERPHIGALAALGFENTMVLVGMGNEGEPCNRNGPRLKFELFFVAGEVVGASAIDLERGKARRHLGNLSSETRQGRLDLGARRPRIALRDLLPLGV